MVTAAAGTIQHSHILVFCFVLAIYRTAQNWWYSNNIHFCFVFACVLPFTILSAVVVAIFRLSSSSFFIYLLCVETQTWCNAPLFRKFGTIFTINTVTLHTQCEREKSDSILLSPMKSKPFVSLWRTCCCLVFYFWLTFFNVTHPSNVTFDTFHQSIE